MKQLKIVLLLTVILFGTLGFIDYFCGSGASASPDGHADTERFSEAGATSSIPSPSRSALSPTDLTPPYTYNHDPEPGEESVTPFTNISLRIADNESGVDMQSISMTVEGNSVSPEISGTEWDYLLFYDPPTDFDFGQIVNVSVSAKDNSGNWMPADIYFFTIISEIPSPPVPPAGVEAYPGDGFVNLTWHFGAVSSVESYNIYRSEYSGGGYVLLQANEMDYFYQDSSTANDVMYYYVVTSVDVYGSEGDYSQEASAMPVAGGPGIPTGLFSEDGSGAVILNWEVPPSDEIAGYNIYRYSEAADRMRRIACLYPEEQYFDYFIAGDDANFVYYLSAVDEFGRESGLSGSTTINPSDAEKPYLASKKPSLFETEYPVNAGILFHLLDDETGVDPNSITISLDTPSTYFCSKMSAFVFKSERESSPDENAEENSRTGYLYFGPNDLTVYYKEMTDLESNALYTVTVEVMDSEAPANYRKQRYEFSTSDAYDTTPPAAPDMLDITASDSSIYLEWSSSVDTDVYGYNIYRSINPLGDYSLMASKHPSNAYRDYGLTNGQTYYYKITCEDLSGNISEYSTGISAMPAAGVPGRVRGVKAEASASSVLLTWQANPEDDVIGYSIYRSTNPSVNHVRIAENVAETEYQDDVVRCSVYSYAVAAVNAEGWEGIPSHYIGVRPLDTNSPVISNRIPEPGSVEVDVDTDVSFHATDIETGVDVNSLSFTCDGSAVTQIEIRGDNYECRIVGKPYDLDSYDEITVQAIVRDFAEPPNITDDIWSFTTSDSEPPSSYILDPDYGQYVGGYSYTIQGSAFDNESGLKEVWVSTDNGATYNETEGLESWTYEWVLEGLEEGAYHLYSKAVDIAGNEENSPNYVMVYLDDTAPESAICFPETGAILEGTSCMIRGLAHDSYSGVVRVEISVDGGSGWSTASGTNQWTKDWSPPGDGIYSLMSRGQDHAGNLEEPTSAVTVYVDENPPVSEILDPQEGDYIAGSYYPVLGTSEDTATGVSQVMVSCDGGAEWHEAYGEDDWVYNWSLPEDGTYLLGAKATDFAEHEEYPEHYIEVHVDNTPPLTTIISPEDGSSVNETLINIRVEAVDAGSGTELVEISVDDGSTWNAAEREGDEWRLNLIDLTEGTYRIISRGTDAAGNVEIPSKGIDLKIDRTPPLVMLGGYWDTDLTVSEGGEFVMAAFVPFEDVESVDMTYGGIETGMRLYDDGSNGDLFAGDNIYTMRFPIGGATVDAQKFLLGLEARDEAGNTGKWPEFIVHSNQDSMPACTPAELLDAAHIITSMANSNAGFPQEGMRPCIFLAGYWNSILNTEEGGEFTFMAYIPRLQNFITSVEIYYGGMPVGLQLIDNGSQGDIYPGDGIYTLKIEDIPPGTPSDEYLFELKATDSEGAESGLWPYLTVWE